jgi:hypothetical protein
MPLFYISARPFVMPPIAKRLHYIFMMGEDEEPIVETVRLDMSITSLMKDKSLYQLLLERLNGHFRKYESPAALIRRHFTCLRGNGNK